MTINPNKERAINHLTHQIQRVRSYRRAGDQEYASHLWTKTQGFLDGLFWADLIREEEYYKWNEMLDAAYIPPLK